MKRGKTICSYIAIVQYAGKERFAACAPSMVVERQSTEQATEALALEEAEKQVEAFFARTFPDHVPRPPVKAVRLGGVQFIPDDHDWKV
jgi:hypothetical protein